MSLRADESHAESWDMSSPEAHYEIVAALNRVLRSSTFSTRPRAREFLAYVVTETLAGRAERLSERTVGRYALGRHADFDGRLDSSVRVQASRVRRALDTHNAHDGAHDELWITLPAGSYVPVLVRNSGTVSRLHAPDEDGDPIVAILEFDVVGGSTARAVGQSLGESLVRELCRFPGVRVIGPSTATTTDPRLIGRRLAARFVLQGSIVERQGRVRVAARLTDASSLLVLWQDQQDWDVDLLTVADLDDGWSRAVAGHLGDETGIILRHELAALPLRSVAPAHAAKLAYYTYLDESTDESVVAAFEALSAVTHFEDDDVLLAMRASAHNLRVAHGLSEDANADLRSAEHFARASLSLEPRNAHAHLALGNTAMLRHDWGLARRHADRAVELGPSHPMILMSAGIIAALAGDWTTGLTWLQEGFRLNPSHPGHVHAYPAVGHLLSGDDVQALTEASLIHAPGKIWGPLYRAMALTGLGRTDQAQEEMAEVLALDPGFLDDPAEYFAGGNFTAEQLRVLLDRVDLILPDALRRTRSPTSRAGLTSRGRATPARRLSSR